MFRTRFGIVDFFFIFIFYFFILFFLSLIDCIRHKCSIQLFHFFFFFFNNNTFFRNSVAWGVVTRRSRPAFNKKPPYLQWRYYYIRMHEDNVLWNFGFWWHADFWPALDTESSPWIGPPQKWGIHTAPRFLTKKYLTPSHKHACLKKNGPIRKWQIFIPQIKVVRLHWPSSTLRRRSVKAADYESKISDEDDKGAYRETRNPMEDDKGRYILT